MYISMSNIISNRIYDEKEKEGHQIGWRKMRKPEREKALEKIKDFLLTTCRTTSIVHTAIKNMGINNLPKSAGIMDRLTTDGYIAGQDYPAELRFVKNWIKTYCY
ncbi:unnamed protein product [marine sediment metagenome]|uniref:Uncharacterized protein n=1 Tax=marine sediment metagenome TaxID=412755 RepID=X1BUA2_9ZZZZ